MLDELLHKLGLSRYEDLREEERYVYRQWASILTTKDVTIEDLKKFLPGELDRARAEAEKYENSEKRDLFFKAYSRLLTTLTQIITTPAVQREQLRERLKKQFNLEI